MLLSRHWNSPFSHFVDPFSIGGHLLPGPVGALSTVCPESFKGCPSCPLFSVLTLLCMPRTYPSCAHSTVLCVPMAYPSGANSFLPWVPRDESLRGPSVYPVNYLPFAVPYCCPEDQSAMRCLFGL